MKVLVSTLLFLSFICFSIALSGQIKALSFNQGSYINLCGTGTQATANTCQRGCDVAKGSCSSNGSNVVKYTCDGQVTDCRSNESGFASQQNIGNPGCGKTVQLDVFSKNCRANGGWDCTDKDLQDYIVWYSGDCSTKNQPQPATASCSDQKPMTVLFKRPGETQWVSGSSFSATNVKVGDAFEVNCFAKNGTALLEGGNIEVDPPQGDNSVISQSSELRNYRSFQTGTHVFRCVSNTIKNCSVSGSVIIKAAAVEQAQAPQKTILERILPKRDEPRGSGNPTPVQSTTPVETKTLAQSEPAPEHKTRCEGMDILSGNESQVPATIKLRARASDNLGQIQRYKFYFGDGKQEETASSEIEHRYESSGSFNTRFEYKDGKGNWRSNGACATTISIKPAPVESHRSGCSDIVVTADNDGRAPSLVKVKVNGFDNKGDIQHYRATFADDVIKESNNQTLEYRYENAGTYVVQAAIKDSHNNWVEGENCRKTVYIETEPLTKQPETGTPTLFTAFSLLSGAGGAGLQLWQRRKKSS